ncbi:hypothetical protein HPB50_020090 [Hyalomma asiaticum]|uniref:Uncharacterized protein n=1 Tax=Hyalomma asiaticum TaxID=266040 RepID=A0ACB7RJ41_HYAAI|nr:hypothetical protein HPB50_020090 [Hyalomma asiaticum]
MPPTGDGGPASTASPLRVDETNMNQFVSTFFQHLQNMASSSTSGIGYATTLAEKMIPEFHGFKDDPTTWVSAVNHVAARHSWPDHTKKSFAEGRLRGAAEAWNRFQGSAYATWSAWSAALTSSFAPLPSAYDARFMEMRSRRQAETEDIAAYIYEKLHLLQSCNIGWTSPASRQIIAIKEMNRVITRPQHAITTALVNTHATFAHEDLTQRTNSKGKSFATLNLLRK